MRLYREALPELYTPGNAITATANTNLVRGQFVAITGDGDENPAVSVAPQGARAFGLANLDTDTGDTVTVERGPGRCFRVPTSVAIAAGTDLEVGAQGQPVPHTDGTVVAHALTGSDEDTVDITLV